YTSASFFSGSVTTVEGDPISGVMIQIEDLNSTTYSSLDGSYESGVPNQGTYTVTYSAPGYQDLIIEVDLTTGESLNFSPQLALVETYAVQISVVDAFDFMGLPAATIHVYNDDFDFEGVTDQNGFVSNSLISGTYNVSIGLWGYQTMCTEITLDGTMVDFSFELDNGYSDDFSVDLGWSIESDVSLSSGAWERVVPSTLSNDEISYSPTEDVSSDCGASAFVTDNGQSQTFEYTVDYQNWGGSLNAPISGFIIHTDDQNAQACDVISSDLSGAIALVRRGSCEFGLKALNAQNAGASAVIIYNNEDTGQPLSTSGGSFGNEVSIPVFSIPGSDGLQLVALLETFTNVSCSLTSNDLNISIANPSDVSGGYTRIISPSMDLSSYQSVSLSYSTWFQNISEFSAPANDSLLIKLSNGEETILVDYRTAQTASSNWQYQQVDVPVDFSLTQNMQLIVETMDLEASNHLVEAGFDQFSVSGSLLSITQINNNPLSIFPNPSVDGLLTLNSIDRASLLSVHDLSGKLIAELNLSEGSNAIDLSHVVKGTYIIQLLNPTQSQTALWIRN
ncbi:MAG: carboxypeptidase regulatory-like domain-containing protein, partial [Flavobacteriales bacterium]|nr:carboxypeptidase regulatory-like domain-containing protein [Flavobacteriales bacterium]